MSEGIVDSLHVIHIYKEYCQVGVILFTFIVIILKEHSKTTAVIKSCKNISTVKVTHSLQSDVQLLSCMPVFKKNTDIQEPGLHICLTEILQVRRYDEISHKEFEVMYWNYVVWFRVVHHFIRKKLSLREKASLDRTAVIHSTGYFKLNSVKVFRPSYDKVFIPVSHKTEDCIMETCIDKAVILYAL